MSEEKLIKHPDGKYVYYTTGNGTSFVVTVSFGKSDLDAIKVTIECEPKGFWGRLLKRKTIVTLNASRNTADLIAKEIKKNVNSICIS